MPYTVKAKLEGLDDVIAALRDLPKKISKRGLKKGVTAASKALKWAARSQAKALGGSGLEARSMGEKIKVKPSGAVYGVVGPRRGFKQEVVRAGRTVLANPTRYAHLVELGTYRSRARQPLTLAFEGTRAAMMEAIKAAVAEALATIGGK